MVTDPYAVLGVPHDADEEQIRQAYRRLAKKYHPDLNPGDAAAAQHMNEVNAAYDQIKNPEAYRQQQQQTYYQQQARQQYQQRSQYDPFRAWSSQGSDSSQNGSYDPFSDFVHAWAESAGQQNTSSQDEEGYHWVFHRTRRRGGLLWRILSIYFIIQLLVTLFGSCGYRRYVPIYSYDYGEMPSGYSQEYDSQARGHMD